jgi:hypothetical protein
MDFKKQDRDDSGLKQELTADNDVLTYKKNGIVTWQIPIGSIRLVDDEQGKIDAETSFDINLPSKYNSPKIQIGFHLQTDDENIYTVWAPIEDFNSFLSEVRRINPKIGTGKLTESLNERFNSSRRYKRRAALNWIVVVAGLAFAVIVIIVSIWRATHP